MIALARFLIELESSLIELESSVINYMHLKSSVIK